MPRKFILAACAALLCAALGQTARAQDDDGGRVEVGGHFTALRVRGGISFIDSNCFTTPCPPSEAFTLERRNEFGFGGRAGYSLNRYLTVEAEVNYFPRD